MTAPLEGIRVLEVAGWLAAPSCAALMADMGADVVKVEPVEGDGYRRAYTALYGDDFVAPCFQFDNRGKRGICVDLEHPEGVELVHRLAARSQVFITNLTQARLERYRLTDRDIHDLYPQSIYAVLSGYGTDGPDSHRAAFDQNAFWARSGAMSVFGDRDDGPLLSRAGYGDRTTALNLLASILAAMRLQEKTGEGQYVEVTLQRTGIWALATDVTNALYERIQPDKTSRKVPPNPIWNYYRTADDRWIAMVSPLPMPYWPKFCAMLGRDDWAADERFQTAVGLVEHGQELVDEIEAVFASEDLAYWREKLDAAGMIWEPAADLPEVIDDPALRERGAFSLIIHEQAGAMEVVSAPFEIRGADIEVRGPAPDAGQHTREVLLEAGVTPERLNALIEKNVLR
ncbi:MAG: CoA transferase [Gammaproteobacteria bacterium]|nr:CoA transferase [Gammaproteobacteria bacterium]MDE0366809.1 CoA transferase [Gammaproteobacteria bacterium]